MITIQFWGTGLFGGLLEGTGNKTLNFVGPELKKKHIIQKVTLLKC